MALSVRSSASLKAGAARKVQPRQAVRPVAAMSNKAAGAAAAAVAATFAAAPAHATDLLATVASAAEGWPFVPPSWAPAVFVPLTGLLIPAIAMATLFVYIEKEAPAKQ